MHFKYKQINYCLSSYTMMSPICKDNKNKVIFKSTWNASFCILEQFLNN